eukprot:scaffold9441_cov167-Amphora_coffeaeformis.AAC.12
MSLRWVKVVGRVGWLTDVDCAKKDVSNRMEPSSRVDRIPPSMTASTASALFGKFVLLIGHVGGCIQSKSPLGGIAMRSDAETRRQIPFVHASSIWRRIK